MSHIRCMYLDPSGQQCDTWLTASNSLEIRPELKLHCAEHRITRCNYLDGANGRCPNDTEPGELGNLCAAHKLLTGGRTLSAPETGSTNLYANEVIEAQNKILSFVHEMSLEKTEEYIETLKKELEIKRAEVFAAKSGLARKYDAMSEEERKELRKQKVTRETKKEPKKPTSPLDKWIQKIMEANSSLTIEQARSQAKEVLGL